MVDEIRFCLCAALGGLITLRNLVLQYAPDFVGRFAFDDQTFFDIVANRAIARAVLLDLCRFGSEDHVRALTRKFRLHTTWQRRELLLRTLLIANRVDLLPWASEVFKLSTICCKRREKITREIRDSRDEAKIAILEELDIVSEVKKSVENGIELAFNREDSNAVCATVWDRSSEMSSAAQQRLLVKACLEDRMNIAETLMAACCPSINVLRAAYYRAPINRTTQYVLEQINARD